jgi:hypothetical protein
VERRVERQALRRAARILGAFRERALEDRRRGRARSVALGQSVEPRLAVPAGVRAAPRACRAVRGELRAALDREEQGPEGTVDKAEEDGAVR